MAAAGTIAVHVLVLVWLSTRPREPPPPPELVLHDIELIDPVELPAAPRSDAPAPTPDPPDEPDAPDAPPDEEPVVHDDSSGRATPTRPRSAGGSDGADAGGSKPSAEPVLPGPPGDAAPQPGALAITGLRPHSKSGGIAVTRPTLEPPAHARNLHAAAGDAAFSPEPSDSKPSSLAAAGFKPKGRSGKRVYKHKSFRAILHPDGRMTFSDVPSLRSPKVAPPQSGMKGPPPRGIAMPGLAEGLRAASGQELYVKEKRALMEWTYELRVQMALEYAEGNIQKRLKSLYRELVSRWHAPGRTAEERREEIFDRWDDCDEAFGLKLPEFVKDAPASIDETRREAGRTARDTIERFVRTHLPEGSADAFTADELRRFNARRRSRERFDPYSTK